VSQVTLARNRSLHFWTTIPATIADTQQPGFFILRQSGERPERYVESFRFDPSSCFCIKATVGSTGVADTPMGQEPPLPEPLAVVVLRAHPRSFDS
jgi:hypothetical protein